MSKEFKVGDHVTWNSEAGRVSGVIARKVTSNTRFKGYVHHASKDDPQYIINSNKTNHVAIHTGTALQHVGSSSERKQARNPRKMKC
jgi:hypothetical protein